MDKEYGVTVNGFKRKTYDDVLTEMQKSFNKKIGDSVNFASHTPQGILFEGQAEQLATAWEALEDVYFAPFIDYGEGTSLDGSGGYVGARRLKAQKSTGVITIIGDEGVEVPKGFRVSDKNVEVIFETTVKAVIPESGEVNVSIVSMEPGKKYNVGVGFINTIANPIMGINEVFNKEPTVNGTDNETDAEFRARIKKSFALGGGTTVSATKAALLQTEGVSDADVMENVTMEEIDGIPPKSIFCLVSGGKDEDIFKTIYANKAGGIQSYGDITTTIVDENEEETIIGFTRPEEVDIYIKLNVKKDEGFPGEDTIVNSVYDYIGGINDNGEEFKGLGLGKDVVIALVVSNVLCNGGIADIEVLLSTDGENYTHSNITIPKRSIAKVKDVVINYV